jgi:hypothetical protein
MTLMPRACRDFDDLVDFSGVACGVNYDGSGHVSAHDDGSDRTRMVNACLVLDTVSNAHIFAQRTGGHRYQNQRLRRTGAKLRLGLCARAGKCAMGAITKSTSTRTDPGALFCRAIACSRPGWPG